MGSETSWLSWWVAWSAYGLDRLTTTNVIRSDATQTPRSPVDSCGGKVGLTARTMSVTFTDNPSSSIHNGLKCGLARRSRTAIICALITCIRDVLPDIGRIPGTCNYRIAPRLVVIVSWPVSDAQILIQLRGTARRFCLIQVRSHGCNTATPFRAWRLKQRSSTFALEPKLTEQYHFDTVWHNSTSQTL